MTVLVLGAAICFVTGYPRLLCVRYMEMRISPGAVIGAFREGVR
jgi:hypothetical protein